MESLGTVARPAFVPYPQTMQVRFLVQEHIEPSRSVATDGHLLQTVGETGVPVLRVYSYPGDVILLGRYHVISDARGLDQISLVRRLSGGRVVPAGQGFAQFSLVLPHRSFFFSEDPYHLAPFQVLNRYVRGVLQGLKKAGIEVFYPGRDLLTVQQQPLGWLSFTTEDDGILLCEGGLSVTRDLSLLPYLLDRADPQGEVPCQFFAPEQVTKLEHLLQKLVSLSDIAGMLRQGFADQFTIEWIDQDLHAREQRAITALAEQEPVDTWLASRPLRSELPFRAAVTTQLGMLQVRFALTSERTLAEVQFSGDLIANPAGLVALEQGLRGCALERAALWGVVDRTFTQPQRYLLGIGPLETIVDAILKGKRV